MENVQVVSEDFEKIVVIGKGGYGTVFLVRKVGGSDHGNLYALKEMKKTKKSMSCILNERDVLERVRGQPFVARLHYTFETETDLNVVLDYVDGGDLLKLMLRLGSFTESRIQFYVSELVLALEHLHKLKVVHRDIKLQNVLIDGDGHIVLCDFGFSNYICDEKISLKCCGTAQYMPPELLQRSKGHPYAADWWALGILTFELLTGHSPFKSFVGDNSTLAIFRRILDTSPTFPETMPIQARLLIESLLNKDPIKRLGTKGAEEVKKHPFFKGVNWEDLEKRKVSAPSVPKSKQTGGAS